jgi:hypothetical protein
MATTKLDAALRALLWAACAWVPAAAQAGTIQWQGDAGVGHTDNIARTSQGERGATIESLGVQFSVLQDGRRLDADLVGDLAWLNYSGDTYSSDLIGNAQGRLRFGVVEDHLTWTIEDRFGQTRRDLFTVETPENRENVNYLSTGPDLRLGLSASTDLLLGGRFALVDYENSPADTRRYSAWTGIEHRLSNSARLSANVTSEWVNPRNGAAFGSYDRNAAFLAYALSGSRSTARIEAGGNRINPASGSSSGFLLRGQFDRSLGQLSRFTLRLGREFTDSGNSLSLDPQTLQVRGPGTASSLVQAAQPFINQYANVAWSTTGRRTALTLSAGLSDENYDGDTLDRKHWQAGFQLRRMLGAHTQVTAGIDYDRDDYENSAGDNSYTTDRLAFLWSAGRRLGLELSAEHYGYNSDLVTGSVNEMRYWFRLRYGDSAVRAPEIR